MKTILTAAWAAVLFITSLPASAAQLESNQPSVRVDYSDLDLTRSHGVSTLQHRVDGAIRQVCGEPAFGLQEKAQQRACERTAGTTASKDIENAIRAGKQLPSAQSAGTARPIANSSNQKFWVTQDRIRHR